MIFLFLRQKMDIRIYTYMIFFGTFGKNGISFSYKYDITILLKKQGLFYPEKMHGISGIIEKYDIHPRK